MKGMEKHEGNTISGQCFFFVFFLNLYFFKAKFKHATHMIR